ncbi:MAG TPA: LysM peptidoglycan-binding domain-containing M23 family metallopeptidase [Candidatus Binatia bacterium]|nr:LysM peptidoglycan-binding domain-containing M23 family metallopeptidase [Candidatus Binatia bacterium]
MRPRAVVAVVVAIGVAACGGPAGLRHRVQRGESLYRIGKAYGVSPEALARVNGIKDPGRIEVGQVVVIPHARRELPVELITPERARDDRPAPPELPRGPSPFVWPVEAGLVTSRFGPRGESHHDGIDISTPEGTPVRAARAGRVLYSDRLRGYGNLIIVAHDQGYATVYAHNRDNRARAGSEVRQGDVIAVVGRTGKTSGPNLHFEVRKDNVARNPLYFLPALAERRAAARGADVVQNAHD